MNPVRFLKSAVLPQDYPAADRPEIALVGRSNSGKSTLLNAICGRKVAKVSGTPGKTRLLNFFDVGDHYRLVDLPGYGYAARDVQERRLWDKMISQFFETRENLIGLLLLCDMRRSWSQDEEAIKKLAESRGLHWICVLTKKDKLGRSESQRQIQKWVESSGLTKGIFKPVSALNYDGIEDLEDYIFKTWVKPLTP